MFLAVILISIIPPLSDYERNPRSVIKPLIRPPVNETRAPARTGRRVLPAVLDECPAGPGQTLREQLAPWKRMKARAARTDKRVQ